MLKSVFFFSFHTQQRICCRAILPKILLTLEMPHYYHWFSVKNHNHLIHTMCGYIYIMGFCAFLLLKSCHCCWGNPFPRSINHKVQQHNNINMWRPDNSDWPDVALVENSLTKLIFLDPRDEISEADKEASSLLKVFAKKVFFLSVFHILSWYLEKDQSEETQIDAFSTDPLCQLGALTHQFHACEYFLPQNQCP